MGVPLSAAVTLALLFLLSVGLNKQVAEGCSCTPRHPQQVFCASDVVIRAKITGKVNSTQPELTAYKIKIIKTFKQLYKKKIQVIYSSQTSCGADLKNGEYLLSGNGKDGVIYFGLCDLVRSWNSLSSAEKQNLKMYNKGCNCEISPCTGASCLIKMLQKKCLIRVNNSHNLDDEEALKSVCLPDSAGFCRWQKMHKRTKNAQTHKSS